MVAAIKECARRAAEFGVTIGVQNHHDIGVGFDAQYEASRGCRDGADVDALDTEQRIRAHAPAASRTRHRVIHVRVSFGIGLLGRYQFKEALTSFPLHHAAPETALPRGPSLRPP